MPRLIFTRVLSMVDEPCELSQKNPKRHFINSDLRSETFRKQITQNFWYTSTHTHINTNTQSLTAAIIATATSLNISEHVVLWAKYVFVYHIFYKLCSMLISLRARITEQTKQKWEEKKKRRKERTEKPNNKLK